MEQTITNTVQDVSTGGTGSLPLVIDILIIVALLFVGAVHGKRGLYNSFMPIVVIILSLFIGITLSNAFTPLAYNYVYPKVEKNVSESYDKEVEAATNKVMTPSKAFSDAFNNMIENFNKAVDEVNESGEADILYKKIDTTKAQVVEKTKEDILQKTSVAIRKLISLILFGLFTAIGLGILTVIKNFFGAPTDWIIIKQVDSLLGFGLGLVECYVVCYVLGHILNFFNIEAVETFAESTKVFKYFLGN